MKKVRFVNGDEKLRFAMLIKKSRFVMRYENFDSYQAMPSGIAQGPQNKSRLQALRPFVLTAFPAACHTLEAEILLERRCPY
jgi:hypothetical protein